MHTSPKPASWDGPHDGEANQCTHGRVFMTACPAEKRIAELEAQLHSTRNTLFARATDVQNLQALVKELERERDEAQEDARAARRERDEAIRTREEQDTEAQHRAEQYCREKREAERERAAATDLLLRIYDRPNWYWATAIKELLDRLKGGA